MPAVYFKNKMLPLRKINDNGLTLLSRNYTCYVNLANYRCLNSFGWYNRWKRPFIRNTWHRYQHNKTEIIKSNMRRAETLMEGSLPRNESYRETTWGMGSTRSAVSGKATPLCSLSSSPPPTFLLAFPGWPQVGICSSFYWVPSL